MERLRGSLRRWRFTAVAAAVLCAALGVSIGERRAETAAPTSSYIQTDAPNSRIVEKVIEPLVYSGYQDFMRPDVSLEMDFLHARWTLKNVHRFDAAGNVVLNEGRYGVCEDLAAYTYQKILPHFPPERYRIEFLEVVESSFFQNETGSRHVILRIADLSAGRTDSGEFKKVYVLDPSLRRYGSPDYFENYRPTGSAPIVPFLQARQTDSTFGIDQGPPILINRRAIVNLFVMAEDGRFDRDHFRILLTATRRYNFVRKNLFVIRRSGGRTFYEESDSSVKKVIGKKEYGRLKSTVERLYKDLEARLPLPGGSS